MEGRTLPLIGQVYLTKQILNEHEVLNKSKRILLGARTFKNFGLDFQHVQSYVYENWKSIHSKKETFAFISNSWLSYI